MAWFTHLAQYVSHAAGRPGTFVLAVAMVALWLMTGPLFGFDERWMWVIHTVTSIITFILVFLLHNTGNRNTEAIQIKLDEVIRSLDKSHKAVLDLEELDAAELDRIQKKYEALAAKAREREGLHGTGL